MKRITGILILIASIFIGCDSATEQNGYGNLVLHFEHRVDDSAAAYDLMIYENAAGNNYEITEIQWFISDLILIEKDGREWPLGADDWIHYVDTDIESSLRWEISEKIQAGEYTGIKFTFGIKGEKNTPGIFNDPPESNMIWPYHMGGDEGGYHYMKLNGFWLKGEIERTPFNFHVGVGQLYDQENNIIGFVQNWFESAILISGFDVKDAGVTELKIVMNIESWFTGPHVYDHEVYGGKIMNNQEAMGKIKENGNNVFTLEVDEE
jgi:hypothetical protein